jgi:hypothetical protein
MSYTYDHRLTRLSEKTNFLFALEKARASQDEITAAFDQLCYVLFGFVEDELLASLTPSDEQWLDGCYYEDVVELGMRNGYDFEDCRTEDGLCACWYGLAYMLLAKEKGLFPTTEEQLNAVSLRREAARFAIKNRSDRQRPRDDRELTKVFGAKRK